VTASRTIARADLTSIRTSTLSEPELLIMEYWLKDHERSPIIEMSLSSAGERLVYFGGDAVAADPALLIELVERAFIELDAWASDLRSPGGAWSSVSTGV
jgi:hypothetical protein